MKPKPRITKQVDGWVVKRRSYGFGPETTITGPFVTQAQALATLGGKTASAGPIIERTVTPSSVEQNWNGAYRPTGPMEIR